MPTSKTAYRYAKAFIEVVEELNIFDEVCADLQNIKKLLNTSRDFLLFLKSPIIKNEKKRVVLSTIFENKVSTPTLKFLQLLVAKGRETILPEIINQFNRLYDEKLGILDINVQTAIDFSMEDEKAIIDHLQKVTKKKVRLHYQVEPSLIGGFILRFDDTIWDASVKHQLNIIRERWIKGSI